MIPRGFSVLLVLGLSTLAANAQLTASDVDLIIKQAATRASEISPASVIAVTDREGFVLGIWNVGGGEPTPEQIATAVSKAGTAAYLSSDQNAFTTRTAAFIIQQHFPPGVSNVPTGPLVGVGLSNLFRSDVNRFKHIAISPPPTPTPSILTTAQSPGTFFDFVLGTSLDGAPGGMPLYKDGHLVGGIGVTGDGTPPPITGFRDENPFIFIAGYDKDEDIALAGQIGFKPSSDILATNVYINGISLEYIESTTHLSDTLIRPGNVASQYPIRAAPLPFPYPIATLGGVEGQIRQPIISDPVAGTINGQPRMTAAEVTSVLAAAADRVRTTRAGIRLPIGIQMEAFITVVNFPNRDGMAPAVLGTFRTGEATLFSWDVAVQKARTAIAYSNNGNTMALSTRTVGFLAQSHYPPGIDANHPGPFFGQQEALSGLNGTLSNVTFPGGSPMTDLPNGITIFPGGFPLYRNGQLIGAIGISGDGVDQDDIVGASGTVVFPTPLEIGADEFTFEGARLPYAKFPRDPTGTLADSDEVVMASPHAITVSEGLLNISTRLTVGAGDNQAIAGFIISGSASKDLVVRALGPSLAQFGVAGVLANPALELHNQAGAVIATNRDWQTTQKDEITAAGLAPPNDVEAAIRMTLAPGSYTAVMSSETAAGGVGLVELYDLSAGSDSELANISTRGVVGTSDDVLIGGFIVGGATGCSKVVTRALGPSLTALGVSGALVDPMLELHDANGDLLMANDSWAETQALDLEAVNLVPTDPREAAAVEWLAAGSYTAVLRGSAGTTGIGLIEAYRVQ
jgi:uncharacterized protein GlcG (DUF336 family)